MFIGRMPTDDMFKDGLNLHNFVKMAYQKDLLKLLILYFCPEAL